MTNQSALAALTTLLALSAGSASGNDQVALATCYEDVIVACGQTAHPQSCALRAFQGCDNRFDLGPEGQPAMARERFRVADAQSLIGA